MFGMCAVESLNGINNPHSVDAWRVRLRWQVRPRETWTSPSGSSPFITRLPRCLSTGSNRDACRKYWWFTAVCNFHYGNTAARTVADSFLVAKQFEIWSGPLFKHLYSQATLLPSNRKLLHIDLWLGLPHHQWTVCCWPVWEAPLFGSRRDTWFTLKLNREAFTIQNRWSDTSKQPNDSQAEILFTACESTEAVDFCASCHPVRCPHGEMNLSNYSLPNQAVLVPLLLQRYSTV